MQVISQIFGPRNRNTDCGISDGSSWTFADSQMSFGLQMSTIILAVIPKIGDQETKFESGLTDTTKMAGQHDLKSNTVASIFEFP